MPASQRLTLSAVLSSDTVLMAKITNKPSAILTQALPEKKTPARDLGRLLETKTLTSYGTNHITETKASELLKYATRLVDEMESVLASDR